MTRLVLVAALVLASASVLAQDMPTFLRNLNRQMGQAQAHYRAGVNIYNRVSVQDRLDYKCAMGDQRACWLHQQQLENADRYMTRHYQGLGR